MLDMSPYKTKEEKAVYDKIYHAARKAQHAIRDKAWRVAHREQIKIQKRKYRAARREHLRAYFRAYRAKNLAKLHAYEKAYRQARLVSDAPKRRARWIKRSYGISMAEFDALLVGQGGTCAICKKSDWPVNGPHVDHDHVTGKVRGILCFKCNAALGYFGDSRLHVQAAVDYLTPSSRP